MLSFIGLCGLFTLCVTFLAGYTLWLLHKPDSPLRTIALRASSAFFAAVIVPVYVVSPIDLIPEAALGPIGLIDDIAFIIAACFAARYALMGPKPTEDSDEDDRDDTELPRRVRVIRTKTDAHFDER